MVLVEQTQKNRVGLIKSWSNEFQSRGLNEISEALQFFHDEKLCRRAKRHLVRNPPSDFAGKKPYRTYLYFAFSALLILIAFRLIFLGKKNIQEDLHSAKKTREMMKEEAPINPLEMDDEEKK